jgi:hypothetical protein
MTDSVATDPRFDFRVTLRLVRAAVENVLDAAETQDDRRLTQQLLVLDDTMRQLRVLAKDLSVEMQP